MKHINSLIASCLFLGFTGIFFWSSCTKPSPFGSELLVDEQADYAYTDTLTLRCTLVPEDSFITSDRASTADYFFCGQLNDPVFGRAQSDIYTLFRGTNLAPNFKDATVDSIVMFLRYDAPGFYGDTLQPQTLRVHRLASGDSIRWDQNYYSNQTLQVGQQIGEVSNFTPKPNIGALLFDTVAQGPYLRIPLDNAFGQELLDIDSLSYTADSSFWIKLRGIRISAESAGSPGLMMAFDLNNTVFSRIRLYYKLDQDTTARSFDFSFVSGNKFANFSHDYSGSTVDPFINQQLDDTWFIQGMAGLRLKVEIPYAHLLDNIAVNKAELELTAATLPGDNPLLTPVSQMVLTRPLGDTAVGLTNDVLYSLGSALTGGFSRFGGFPETEFDNGMNIERYRLTLTRRFQAMVDNSSGDIKEQTVYIGVYAQNRNAMRAIFYGPQSTTFPAKLALKYTKIQ